MLRESVRSLTVDGLSYSYRLLEPAAPRSEPLLVLGGAFQSLYDWPQLEDALTDVAGVVTIDLPGAGTSDWPRPEHTIDTLDAALAAVIDDLNAPRVSLFGYSYGSVLTFRYAQRHPERCARLLLGGVLAHVTDAQLARYAEASRLLQAGDTEGFVSRIAAEMFCLDETRYVHRRELARRYFRRTLLRIAHRQQAQALLDRVFGSRTALAGGLAGVPTLVFAGEHDTINAPSRQRAFASTIDGSQFMTIPDCDHMMLMECPATVASLVASFVTGRPAPEDGVPTLGERRGRPSVPLASSVHTG